MLSHFYHQENEMNSEYDFNPERCKKAIEGLSKMVHDNGYTAIPTRDKMLLKVILDDLILDIEALHQRAVERDEVLNNMMDAINPNEEGWGYSADGEELRAIYHCYTDDDGALVETEPLNL